jgi:hypothetical protein
MSKPDEDSNFAAPLAGFDRASSITLAFMTPSLQSLIRAVELGAEERWELALVDIECVEAMWEMCDAYSTSHGFVLGLTDGRRAYLQYVSDEDVEEVEILPMGDERFPVLGSSGFEWSDAVGDLNRFLRA